MTNNLQYLVILGAIVQLYGVVSYIKETLKGNTKPNRVTWLLWSTAPLIATFAAISDGVSWSVLPVFTSGFGPLLVLISSFVNKKAYWKLEKSDYICGFFSILALIFWWLTKDPGIAIIFSIASDGLAAIPTLVKSWKYPETETVEAYSAGLFNSLTSFAAVRIWNFSALAFPIYLVIINSSLIVAVYGKRIIKILDRFVIKQLRKASPCEAKYDMTQKITFQSTDGLSLTGIWHLPEEESTRVIVLAHGITVDKDENGIFIQLAERLVEEGFSVFRFDFRGHGESKGKSVDMTVTGEVEDLESAIEEVKKKGYTTIGLLGASFGGGIATLYASKHQKDIVALCLWNPALNYDHTFLNPTSPWVRDQKEHMRKDILEKGWTTLGSKNFVIGKALFDDMARLKPFEALKNITIPTLFLHGTNDTKVSFEDSKEYINLLSNGKLVIFDGAEHGFHKDWETKRALDETVAFFGKKT